ncbi:MAG TPA: DUF4383 domain-containing protein [Kofleriaceae bacterium]|nr:DUF4383 domain-containing protein [Kofleriaceae bacterium]
MRKSPAQVYALVFGVALLLAGILGFFYTSDFTTSGEGDREALLGVFDVNGWHNVVHLASGLLGLALAGSWRGARLYAWGFGLTYLVVTVWGFVIGDGEEILGLIPVNTEDNFLHLAISLLGIFAALLTPSAPPPTTADASRTSPAFRPSVRRRAQVKTPVER